MPKTFTPKIHHYTGTRIVEVETELGLVRVHYGLADYEFPGQQVEYVELIQHDDETIKIQDSHFMTRRRVRLDY